LDVTAPLRGPIIQSIIQSLNLPGASHGLDAGCGTGQQTFLLAEAVGKDGHVTGVDIAEDLVAHAKAMVHKSGYAGRLDFVAGDINRLPFAEDVFDWALSIDCAGYHPADPFPALREMARAVKPGGIISLMAYSSQQLLPGYPFLEARLNATCAGIAPYQSGMSPSRHFARALGWFYRLGFQPPRAATFVQSLHAPLADEIRAGLASLLDMRWGNARSELSLKDRSEYQRLCESGSRDYILDLPDYYGFFTYSVFTARLP